jgi:type II secretory pathway pseudopilin PulG
MNISKLRHQRREATRTPKEFLRLRRMKHLTDEPAFTFTELLAVLGSLSLLLAMTVPLLAGSRANSDRVVCQSNLRQIGQAYAMWADDHGGKYPQFISSSEGGNNDSPLSNDLWFQFLFLKTEIGTPRSLACPTDSEKHPAVDWSTSPTSGFNSVFQRNRSCSYILSLGILQSPHGLLSADRNIIPTTPNGGGCAGGPFYAGFPRLNYQSPTLDWTGELHNKSGNIVLNDGSVIAAGQSELRGAVQNAVQPGSYSLCVMYP